MIHRELCTAHRCIAILLAFVLAGAASTVVPQVGDQQARQRLGVRLRCFVPNAHGSLYFDPTPSGGIVRLTVLGLPEPQALMPDAHVFSVWAVTTGERPIHVGDLHTDGNGNGGLEFARPASFERYSIVVTAEVNSASVNPLGPMVLASVRDAATAFYGERQKRLSEARRKSLERQLEKSVHEPHLSNDFYAEVDRAVIGNAARTRLLELLGDEIAPEAYGLARFAVLNENAYVRTLLRRLPPPSQIGARTYVLWGIVPTGRITYMGSLQTENGGGADAYVRVGGFKSADLDLAVTAEMSHLAMRPSARRTLSALTAPADSGPVFGAIEGRVLDQEGKALSGAIVEIDPVDEPVVANSLPRTTTDEQGRFFLDGIPTGTHLVYASKEEEGYPPAYMAFFVGDKESIPKVTVHNKEVAEGVEVRLGPKASRVVGQVKDAETGRPVEGAEIIFYRENNPESYFSFGLNEEGKFQQLIPSAPLRMKVSAPGYEDWYYGKGGLKEQSEVIQMAPNTTKEFTIYLRSSKHG